MVINYIKFKSKGREKYWDYYYIFYLANRTENNLKTEDPGLILEIVEKVLKFNKRNKQKGQGIKILTPNQMLNRLPIALAQLQAGDNSKKLKSEIRQLLYYLYRSKNMTEQIYQSLVSII